MVVDGDDVDVAVLRCDAVTGQVKHLTLSTAPPQPGHEVIVFGYPTGMRAPLARAGEGFVQKLRDADEMSFWTAARRLSDAGRIGPLATHGIVGQVSATAVLYDAVTTSGGSGGSVVGLDGEVVAVNTAIMPEFGGSNLGVPVECARKLLVKLPTTSAPEAIRKASSKFNEIQESGRNLGDSNAMEGLFQHIFRCAR